jgi:hypothetical protein
MSYLLTDAVDDDMRAELKVLRRLNEEIDQLASEARRCDTLVPSLQDALGMAWYFAEDAQRESSGVGSCGHTTRPDVVSTTRPPTGVCECCRHFAELRGKAEQIRRLL